MSAWLQLNIAPKSLND